MEVDEDNLLQGGKGVSNITDYVSKVCLSILSISIIAIILILFFVY